ncbi:hypothetical protein ACHAWF_014392 [Thalassiosira exigua]
MLELVLAKDQLASEDNCGEFATKLWAMLAEQGPAHPLTIDHDINVRKKIISEPGHKLFWLALDAVGHHLLIEKNDGKYRVYQSYITQCNFGYTAGQWCFGFGNMKGKPTWIKLGGGKLLTDEEVNYLLDLVVRWQELLLTALKEVLLSAVPGLNPDAIPYLQRGAKAGDPVDLISPAIDHIVNWSKGLIDRIGPEGCTDVGLDPITRHVLSGCSYISIWIGSLHSGELIFTIPAGLYNKCDSLNRKMTGEPFNPATFLMMLNTGVWWECRKGQDSGSAIGFKIRAMDMDMVLSEDEGIRCAEQMGKTAVEQSEVVRGRRLSNERSSTQGPPTLSSAEVARFLCPEPYSCCGNDPLNAKVLQASPRGTRLMPEAAPGTTVALLSRCGCNRLAVRSLNVTFDGHEIRVIIDPSGMTQVPGASINPKGRHPNMLADTFIYASQALGVTSSKHLLLCEAIDSSINNTFEVREELMT